MDGRLAHRELLELDRERGDERGLLDLGLGAALLEGLDPSLRRSLELRWGPFLGDDGGRTAVPLCRVRVLRAAAGWLPANPGELYRVEAFNDPQRRLVASYNFALCEDGGPDRLRVALHDDGAEPLGRALENALRVIAARLALAAGGFAMHGAGVLGEGRAELFAGPSGSGKTTAVELSGRPSLGDDYALVARRDGAWVAAALPFDNSERVAGDSPRGLFPLGGIWRLFKSGDLRVERPPATVAVPSLLGCAAFPWLFPEQGAQLLERCAAIVAQGRFAHLHFPVGGELWTEILRCSPGPDLTPSKD